MTSPQEEAEALLAPIAINSWSKSEVRNAIPLAELIAVARAAAKKDSFLHASSTLSEKAIHEALQDLRATGKVEGI